MNGWMAQGSGLHSGRDPCCLAYSVARNTARVPPCNTHVRGPRSGTVRHQGERAGSASDPEVSPRSCRLAQGGAKALEPATRGTLSLVHWETPTPALSHPGQAHPAGPPYPARRPQPLGGGGGVPGDRERLPTKGSALQSRSASTQPLRVEPDLADPEKLSPPTCTLRH